MAGVAILGGSGTIGAAVAERLVAAGRPVLLLGRSAEKLSAVADRLGVSWAVVDPMSSESMEGALAAHSAATDGFDGLVNATGSVLLKGAHLTSDEEFRQTLEANLFTAFAIVKAAARTMRQRGGSVVLFASAAAEIGIANHEAIAAAKAGVIGLARSAAATYAANNLRFNVVSPGLVRTEMTRRIWENAASATASTEMHALGRLGEADRIASAVVWLLDPANDWTTGQVLGVDGGLGHVLARRRG